MKSLVPTPPRQQSLERDFARITPYLYTEGVSSEPVTSLSSRSTTAVHHSATFHIASSPRKTSLRSRHSDINKHLRKIHSSREDLGMMPDNVQSAGHAWIWLLRLGSELPEWESMPCLSRASQFAARGAPLACPNNPPVPRVALHGAFKVTLAELRVPSFSLFLLQVSRRLCHRDIRGGCRCFGGQTAPPTAGRAVDHGSWSESGGHRGIVTIRVAIAIAVAASASLLPSKKCRGARTQGGGGGGWIYEGGYA